ncbi:FAM172 family protein homolog CG10038 [Ostrinia nubilalis]|uniref:FAM172 family protein homolog CG10038 n=1 Tax=Ostrinia nubilalis TaxID=29057 RepID=UPI0030825294
MLRKHISKLGLCCRSVYPIKPIVPQINYTASATTLKNMEAVKSMKDLGYAFNSDGQLRKIGPDGKPSEEPFQFNISDQHQECQAHYEELGSAITEHIYSLLETKYNLVRLPVPVGSTPATGTFIFASKDYNHKDVLLVLINGSGAVRAGQWARSLIINENLEQGTQIPYIERAIAKGYGVMILNTNDNYQADGKKIPHSSSAEEHAYYVWETYISKAKATSVVIVAHSYGGVVTVSLADQLKSEFEKRVKAIAFTDSVHAFSPIKMPTFMKEITRNWISSSAPLDTPMKTPEFDCPRVSAGHPRHEMSSCSCIESAFIFVEEKLTNK